MAMKHHFWRLQAINKGNNINIMFLLYIQMAKTRNISYSTHVKMQVLHEEGCGYRQITTRCGCRHTTARRSHQKISAVVQSERQIQDWTTQLQYRKRRSCSASPVSNRQEENGPRTEATVVGAVRGPVYNQNRSWSTFETWFQVV